MGGTGYVAEDFNSARRRQEGFALPVSTGPLLTWCAGGGGAEPE